MLASDFQTRLAPFTTLINARALSVNYRALYLSPTGVRGCAAYGSMEVEVATGLDREVHVDGDMFLQVLRSLPAAELEMQISDGSLRWKCGAARGQLATLGEGVEVAVAEWPKDLKMTEVTPTFGQGLDLGSIACGTTALMSVGLFGVTIHNEGMMTACSTDNNTIASAKLGEVIPGPAMTTLSPDGAKIVSMIVSRSKASVAINDTTIYCRTPDTKLVVKQIPPLKFPVQELVAKYLGEEIAVDIRRDIIAAFVRRAEALTEEKKRTDVAISAEGGSVRLLFSEGKASSEEYYLSEGGPSVKIDPIWIDSRRMSRALVHASKVVFDYASAGALTLRGPGSFVFVISGRGPEAA